MIWTMKYKLYFLLLSVALLWSCSDEKFVDNTTDNWYFLASIENEAALKLYKMPEGIVDKQDYFFEKNGEVLPSQVTEIKQFHDKYFLVMPKAFKIYVCDLDFKKIAEIDYTDLQLTPTSICSGTNSSQAYVLHQNDNKVSNVDIQTTFTATGIIEVGDNPVSITNVGNQIYTANANENTISVMHTNTDKVNYTLPVHTRPIYVGASPDNERLLVVCYGDTTSTQETGARSYLYDAFEPPQLINTKDFGQKYNEFLRPYSTTINNIEEAHIVTQRLTVNLNTVRGNTLRSQLQGEFIKVTFSSNRNELYFYDALGNIQGFSAVREFDPSFEILINNIDFIYPI